MKASIPNTLGENHGMPRRITNVMNRNPLTDNNHTNPRHVYTNAAEYNTVPTIVVINTPLSSVYCTEDIEETHHPQHNHPSRRHNTFSFN